MLALSVTQIFEMWIITGNRTEFVRTGMIQLVFSSGMCLVEEWSWKN